MERRALLIGGTVLAVGTIGFWAARIWNQPAAAGKRFEINRTDDEWKELLSRDAYLVLREEATERPYTSPLLKEAREGIYACAGCDLPVYASGDKYDSRTGWPSFTRAINETAVGTKVDHKLIYPRTEAHCNRCGGHLGHIFEDGPAPTGMRHCINGLALQFHETA